jgi:hypothetical protein
MPRLGLGRAGEVVIFGLARKDIEGGGNWEDRNDLVSVAFVLDG